MAGEYLPPVVQRVTADVSEYIAKLEEAKAAQDDFAAHTAEISASMKGESELGGAGPGGMGPGGALGMASRDMERSARDAGTLDKQLTAMQQTLTGPLQTGLQNMSGNLKSVAGSLQQVQQIASGFSGFFSGLGGAGGQAVSAFTGPLGLLGSLVDFGKQWAVMIPTLFAAPALLGAIAGAAGGLAGSFTVLATAAGLFAAGAMTDLSEVTSVSTMAQFDALSAPLQKLYYAYHNLSNEWTILTQTMGQTTFIEVLTNMFTTFQTVLGRIAPVMGEIASAGQSAFNVLSGSLLGPEFTKFIDWVGAEATPVLTTFSQTFVNLASGWAGLMEGLTPAITLFDNGMVKLTQSFTNWANSPKGQAQIEGFVNYIKSAWPDITKFWSGLGHIFYEFFSSASKAAPTLAADLGGLFTTIGNAMPTLVQFADTVLPGIVKGFGQFTGGFFGGLAQGLGPLLDAFGKKGPNWHQIGEDVGKMVGELLSFLPAATKVATKILEIVNHLLRVKGVIGDIVKAWLIFEGIMVAGKLASAFSQLVGAFSTIHSLAGAAGAEGAGVGDVAAGAGGLGLAGGTAVFGAALLPAAAALLVLTHTAKQNSDAFTKAAGAQDKLFGNGAGVVSRYTLASPSQAAVNALHTAQGVGQKNIKIETHHHIQVSGPIGSQGLAEIDKLLDNHDAELVRQLNMGRN